MSIFQYFQECVSVSDASICIIAHGILFSQKLRKILSSVVLYLRWSFINMWSCDGVPPFISLSLKRSSKMDSSNPPFSFFRVLLSVLYGLSSGIDIKISATAIIRGSWLNLYKRHKFYSLCHYFSSGNNCLELNAGYPLVPLKDYSCTLNKASIANFPQQNIM